MKSTATTPSSTVDTPTAHVCKCKHTVDPANARARATDRYDKFEDLFIREFERLINDIKSIERAYTQVEHSSPALVRHTKAYSELEAKKIQESAHKILARTECFFQESKKLADQVVALSRHAEKLNCVGCNECNKPN